MKRNTYEKGAIMVEASIYLPLVLCTVMALIYLALFNMQEYLLMYQAQRIAFVAAREVAYPGYDQFQMGQDNEIEFDWGEKAAPSAETIQAYYKTYHSGIKELYREIAGWFTNYDAVGTDYGSRFADEVKGSTLLALNQISEPSVEIDRGLLGTNVTVTITHTIPTPGVLKYLDYYGEIGIRSSAYTYSLNPTGFVRNVNLASDCVSYIFEKLGMSDGFNGFVSKTKSVINKIL